MKNIVFDALVSFIKKLEKNQTHPKIEKLREVQRKGRHDKKSGVREEGGLNRGEI